MACTRDDQTEDLISNGRKHFGGSGPLDKTKASFLDLPAEVRLLVYPRLLVTSNVEHPPLCPCDKGEGGDHDGSFKDPIRWRILLTCKTIYSEAYHFLYRDNWFMLRNHKKYCSPRPLDIASCRLGGQANTRFWPPILKAVKELRHVELLNVHGWTTVFAQIEDSHPTLESLELHLLTTGARNATIVVTLQRVGGLVDEVFSAWKSTAELALRAYDEYIAQNPTYNNPYHTSRHGYAIRHIRSMIASSPSMMTFPTKFRKQFPMLEYGKPREPARCCV